MLNLSLFFVVEHIKFLNCASLLRREIEVVISVMLVLALPLFRYLARRGAVASHGIDVLLDAGPGVESDVHYVQGRLARLLRRR